MESPLFSFAGICFQPYPFVLFALMLIYAGFKKTWPVCRQILEAMNLLLALAGSLYLVLLAADIYNAFKPSDAGLTSRIRGPYWWAYWLRMLWLFFPIIFWSKKLRVNVWLSIIASTFVLLHLFIERLVILMTGLYRDARPSSWSYSSSFVSEYIFLFAVYAVIVAAVYFLRLFLHKKKVHSLTA